MKRVMKTILFVSIMTLAGTGMAGTYKCNKNGQSVYSDTPCAPDAARVDQGEDHVSRDQKRQAYRVQQENKQQLRELEYENIRDRYTRRPVHVIPR